MPDIKCPVCGEINTADQEFCQYCQARLQPLTGPLKGADAPIQPGQIPTKKNTAELEPILPQWLREARDKARKTAAEEASQAAQENGPEAGASGPDLLAGLQSQAGEDEEEMPDWLASITGAEPKSRKAESESTDVHWIELGKPDEFADDEETGGKSEQEPSKPAEESEMPPWFAQGQTDQQGSADELTAWLREAELGAEPKATETAPSTEAGPGPFDASPSSEETPDWLKSLQGEQETGEETPPAEEPALDLGGGEDWLKKLQDSEPVGPATDRTETPAWLRAETGPSEPAQNETPAWLRSSSSSPAFEAGDTADEEIPSGELPDWLKAAAPQSSVFAEEPVEPEATETPDWLTSLQKDATTTGVSSEASEESSFPAFADDSLIGENANALFTEMPDWLSSVAGEETKAPSAPAPTPPPAEALTPGELPSWVQAMRPVESGITQTPGTTSGDQTLETRGALAGLQGVLPAVPGMGPTSKPKAYSIKLQASEEQQSHAALLEQILAAETAPEPIASFAPLAAQRGLRWLLASLLLLIIGGVVLGRTQIFALPTGEPAGLRDARLITETIPQGAPVLVVIDYEPARVGEMEAVAGPLLEHAIVLRQPVFTFISTSPTGGLLTEHLMTIPLAARGYVRGTNYFNLGFLPGGLTGVRAFAQNPPEAAPFDMDMQPAWSSGPLQGVTSLSGFAAMIVVTDNSESARTWIEQTADMRPSTPIVMVSSSQAGPMIQPYYDSRQVSGVVNGLQAGAILKQSNGDIPSLAQKYWDGFSLGMLLAMLVIGLGGLWNLALGVRDRAAAEGK